MSEIDGMLQGPATDYLKQAVKAGRMTPEKATALLYAHAKGGLTWYGARTSIEGSGDKTPKMEEADPPELLDDPYQGWDAKDKLQLLREKLREDRNRSHD